jgi:hypothetical protein
VRPIVDLQATTEALDLVAGLGVPTAATHGESSDLHQP